MNAHRPRRFCYHYSPLYELSFLYDFLSPPLLYGFWRRLALKAAPHPGERIADLCCGPGYLTQRLARRGTRVVGLDLLPQMLRRARAKGGFPLILASVHRLPFRDGSLDKVTLSLALHEMPPSVRLQVLREVHRVLRPGGWVVLGEMFSPRRPWQRLFIRVLEDPSLVAGMVTFAQELSQAGLTLRDQEDYFHGFLKILLAVK